METEIKLSPVEAAVASQVFADELLRPHLGDVRRSDMESTYYIDKYGILGKMKAGLRLRLENGEGVCCLKVSRRTEGSAKVREEYEVPAETIADGVVRLCALEALPDELRAVLEGTELAPVCGCSFTRTEADYDDGCYLFFGRETTGLPEEFLDAHYESCVRIPMRAEARSLNLSNSVAVGVFEALRQLDFPHLKDYGKMKEG